MITKHGPRFSLRVFNDKREGLEKLMNELSSDFNTEIVEVKEKRGFKWMLMIKDLEQVLDLKTLLVLLQANNSSNGFVNLFVSFSAESDISGFSFTQSMIDIISITKCSVDISLIFIN